MSPKRLPTRIASKADGRERRRIAQKYLEVAAIAATEPGIAVNVAIGNAVLAGIAAGDAICIAATGERYAGADHAAAAELLRRVSKSLGDKLGVLVSMKTESHYGPAMLSTNELDRALRAARALVNEAVKRNP